MAALFFHPSKGTSYDFGREHTLHMELLKIFQQLKFILRAFVASGLSQKEL
jgi:hypothetical protein